MTILVSGTWILVLVRILYDFTSHFQTKYAVIQNLKFENGFDIRIIVPCNRMIKLIHVCSLFRKL